MSAARLTDPTPTDLLGALGGEYDEVERYRPNGFLIVRLQGPNGTVTLHDTDDGVVAEFHDERRCDRCGAVASVTLSDDTGRARDACESSDCHDHLANDLFATGAERVDGTR